MGGITSTSKSFNAHRTNYSDQNRAVGIFDYEIPSDQRGAHSTGGRNPFLSTAAETGWSRYSLDGLDEIKAEAFARPFSASINRLIDALSHLEIEQLVQLLYSDSGCCLGAFKLTSSGTDFVNGTYRSLFENAWFAGARKFLLVHNHPSDNPFPSNADVQFTRHVNAICVALDVELIDHFVVSRRSAFSIKGANLL